MDASKYPAIESIAREHPHWAIRAWGVIEGLGAVAFGILGLDKLATKDISTGIVGVIGAVALGGISGATARLDVLKTRIEAPLPDTDQSNIHSA